MPKTSTSFKPGVSGNPGGRPASARRYRELFTQQVTETQFVGVVDAILQAAHGGDLQACKIILEYMIGRPTAEAEAGAVTGDLLAALIANVKGKSNGHVSS